MDLHPEVCEFAHSLRLLEGALRSEGEVFWAGKVAKIAGLAEQSDGVSVARFLELFGGMGSLNDLASQEEKPEKGSVRELLSRSYCLAYALKN